MKLVNFQPELERLILMHGISKTQKLSSLSINKDTNYPGVGHKQFPRKAYWIWIIYSPQVQKLFNEELAKLDNNVEDPLEDSTPQSSAPSLTRDQRDSWPRSRHPGSGLE